MRRWTLLTTSAFVSALLGCGSSRNTDGGPQTSTVSGTVSGRAANAIQGATATVLLVGAAGSITAVSQPAALDSAGRYAAQVTFSSAIVGVLVVQIQSAGETVAEALVAESLTNGSTLTAPPASLQTSIQTRVFLAAEQSGLWDSNATTGGLSALIDIPTAEGIAASASTSTDLQAAAAAVAEALDARGAILSDVTVHGSAAMLRAFLAAETDAQAQEDAALDAATGPTSANAAIQARGTATVTAAMNASVPLALYEAAARASNVAYTDASIVATSAVQSAMVTAGAQIEATAVTAADAAALQALGASSGISGDLAAAALELGPAIAISGGSAMSIAAAWEAYETSALADVKAASTAIHMDGGSNIDGASILLATPLYQVSTALVSAASAAAIVQVLTAFDADVATAIAGENVLSTFTTAQMSAVDCMLVSIELHGGYGSIVATGGTIAGLVENPPTGTTVLAYEAGASGSLTAVSVQTTVSAMGAYTLHLTATGVTDTIVVATSAGTVVGRVIVSGTVPAGGMLTAAPIDSQTTVQTDLFLSALMHGYWSSSTNTTAALRGYVSAGVASALAGSSTYNADVQLTAKALISVINARQALLSLPAIGLATNAIAQFMSAETAAQQTEDVSLNAATTQAEVANAVQAREDAELSAAAMSDMSPAQFSLATLAATDAAQASSTGISMPVQTALEVTLEGMEAHFLAKANEVELNAFVVSASVMNDLVNADASLESGLAASSGGAQAIAAAWAQYDQTAQGDLQATAEAAQPGSSAAIASVMSQSAAAVTSYQAQLMAAGQNPGEIAQAAAGFASSVQAAVGGNATLGMLTGAEMAAVSAVLVNLLVAG